MYYMTFDITVGSYSIQTLDKVTIKRSVETLGNTAVIVLPRTVYNRTMGIESKFNLDDPVTIKLGYDGKLETEFEGFLSFVSIEESSITLECEDYIFFYRMGLAPKELKDKSVKEILKHVNDEISALSGKSLSLSCDLSNKYTYIIEEGETGLEVLNEIRRLTKTEIYMEGNTLYCHSQFSRESKKVAYDFSLNIESADLKYKTADSTKFLVIGTGTGADGMPIVVKKGIKGGGVKRFSSTEIVDENNLQKEVEEAYNKEVYTGYEGSFNAWLVPYCDAGYAVTIEDSDKEYPKGSYYVLSVETTFSKAGGVRRISLGKKLS